MVGMRTRQGPTQCSVLRLHLLSEGEVPVSVGWPHLSGCMAVLAGEGRGQEPA